MLQIKIKGQYNYKMCGMKLNGVQCVKDLGVNIASNLKFSQQSNDAAIKQTEYYWASLNETTHSKIKNVTLIYNSLL